MKKKCIFITALVLCVGIAIGAAAASLVENIKAELRRDFTIVVDGQTRTFYDVNGKQVYPVLYDGTTYLPIRAIGELMGKDVYWYEDEKKIELRDKADQAAGKTSTVTDADFIVSGDYGSDTSTAGLITLEQAKTIVLTKAGVSEADVTFTKTKLDRDDGIVKFEIDFITSDTEYETEIDAANGNIIEWELDAIRGKGSDKGIGVGPVVPNNGTDTAYAVSIEEAKDIALQRAGVAAADAVFTKQERDMENGRPRYEIEFISGGTEYEADIDCETGDILGWKTEVLKGYEQGVGFGPAVNNGHHNDGQNGNVAQGVITLDEAQNIALQRAGLAGTAVTFTKSKLEWDDGIQKYELEFRYNGREYEFEINAATGAVIEYDVD